MAARIIVIDPAADEADEIAYLTRHGLEIETLPDAEPILRRLAMDPPALVLILRRAGAEPGLFALRRLRAVSAVPVILCAMAADDEAERISALELGADDYLRRGTSARELLARIRTVTRRSRVTVANDARHGWQLCLQRRELFAPDGAAKHLTSAEFALLFNLSRQQGEPVARDALSLAVLRRPYHPEDRALDNLVLRLRRKLGDDGPSARLIKSIRGIGYVFVGFEEAEAPREHLPRMPAIGSRTLAVALS